MRTPARVAAWAAALAVLAAVFAAWRSPHLVVDLAAFVAACF
jgi:hypothetical protein